MSAGPSTDIRWMHGPLPDLLVGCGGIYALGFVTLLATWGDTASHTIGYTLPLFYVFISLPHYGGTLVRVYESREQIGRYAVFSVYITAALCAWFAIGTWNALVGSLMITLYLSWSPWHYSGQNYGIALMFLGRAGVSIDARAKNALWLSFVLSYVLTLLTIHASRPTAVYAGDVGRSTLQLLPLGIPESVGTPSFAVVTIAYIVSLAVALRSLLRAHSLRALLPAAAVVASQALWFVVPYAGIRWMKLEGPGQDTLFLQAALVWVAVAHAAQYLWITSYYARSMKSWRGFPHYFAKTFLFSSVAFTVPALVFAPYALGGAAYDEGLGLLIVALVNIHHFQLDGAIWKLRDGPIARILIRSESSDARPPAPTGATTRRLGLHAITAAAIACAGVQLWIGLGRDLVLPWALETGHARVSEAVVGVGAWIGVGTPPQRVRLGRQLLEAGDEAGAKRQFVAAAAASDTAPRAHYELARMALDEGETAAGIDHLRRALEIRPGWTDVQRQLDQALRLQSMNERGATGETRR